MTEPAPRPETVEVPVEPTPEMIRAADKVANDYAIHSYGGSPSVEAIWDAMISARPPAASPAAPEGEGYLGMSKPALDAVLEDATEIATLRAQLAEAEDALEIEVQERSKTYVIHQGQLAELQAEISALGFAFDGAQTILAEKDKRIGALSESLRAVLSYYPETAPRLFDAEARALLSAAEGEAK